MALISATPRAVSKTSAKGLFRLNDIAEHQAAGNFPSDKILDLNFVNNATIGANAAPDDAIDFSRASQATFTDSDGLVKNAPHNLILQSEDFSSNWTTTNVTIATNQIADPDGNITADLVTENSSNAAHRINLNVSNIISDKAYTFSVFVKPATFTDGRVIGLVHSNASSIFDFTQTNFNLTDGTIDSQGHETASITDVGNGWFRLVATETAISSGTGNFRILFNKDGNSYQGDGSSGVYLWGAQLSQHKFVPIGNPYIKTTSAAVYGARLDHEAGYFLSADQPQNLVEYSEDISSGYSFISRATITSNDTTAPDGTTTADKIVDNTEDDEHYFRYVFEGLPNTDYVVSFHIKADELSRVHVVFASSLGWSNGVTKQVNLDNQTLDLISGSETYLNFSNLEDVGSGWYRASFGLASNSSTGDVFFDIRLAKEGEDGSGQTYLGNGTDGLHIWGIQVEVNSTASGTYVKTEGLPYYGGGATQNGLLIEEQRVNIFEYSEEFDNAAWTLSNATISANQVIAPDGTLTADELIYDNGSSTGRIVESFNSSSQNTDYTLSCFIKNNGLNTSSLRFYSVETGFIQTEFDLRDGTITSTTSGASSSIKDYGNGWFRVSLTFNTGLAATSKQTQICRNAFQGDGTLSFYVWGAQLEEGAFPTSYIPTSGSTVTRSADLATMSTGSLPFTGYNQSEGTIETKFEFVGLIGNFARVYQFGNSNQTERFGVNETVSAGAIYESMTDSVAGQTLTFNQFVISTGGIINHLLSYKDNDVAIRRSKDVSGSVTLSGFEDSSVTVPDTINRLGIGCRPDIQTNISNIIFKYFRYYPRRLSNDTLFAIRRG